MEPIPPGPAPEAAEPAAEPTLEPGPPSPIPEPAPPPPRPYKSPRPPRVPVETTLPWIVRWGTPFLVLFVAFHFYNADLEEPSIVDFDEAHYIKVARNFTRGVLIDPAWPEPRPHNFEHPPLGKYLMALGLTLNGKPHIEMENQAYLRRCNFDNPECAKDAYAWRIATAWVASFGVLGMYWLGLRLFNRYSAGILASALLLLDGLYYIHARLAMLDAYVIAFGLLAFGVALGPSRGHRWASAILFGFCIGSKFPGLFLMPPFLLLHFLISGQTNRWMRLRDALLKAVIVPLVVVIGLFLPFFLKWYDLGGGGFDGIRYSVETWVFVEKEAFKWTYGAAAGHPYVSKPWTWIAMTRPVFYYVTTTPAGDVGHIYAMGNPFLWWSASLAWVAFGLRALPRWFLTERMDWRPGALWDWWRRRFAFTRETSLWFAFFLFASTYGPFFLLKRQPFNFYFLLACPFLSLFVAGILSERWTQSPGQRLLVLLYFGITGVVFAFFYPIYGGIVITQKHFDFVFNAIPWMSR